MKHPFPASGTTDRRRGMTVVAARLLVVIVVLVGVIAVPALFRNKELTKVASRMGEEAHVAIRAVRRQMPRDYRWKLGYTNMCPTLIGPSGKVLSVISNGVIPSNCSIS